MQLKWNLVKCVYFIVNICCKNSVFFTFLCLLPISCSAFMITAPLDCWFLMTSCIPSGQFFYIMWTSSQFPLRKQAYTNILKILPQKKYRFLDKKFEIFQISVQNIDCGYSLEPPRRGGSNEYPQSMFWAGIRKIMYTPVNPSFTI